MYDGGAFLERMVSVLKTPLGEVRVLADGKSIDYKAVPHSFDKPMTRKRPLAGCWRIRVCGAGEVRCILEGCSGLDSSGEGYQAVEFANGAVQLVIGTETDREDRIVSPGPEGIAVALRENGMEVVFGIAWTADHEGDSDVRAWFAADPTLD